MGGYNHVHLRSGIRFVTPQQRQERRDQAILAQRQAVYEQARRRHPERWSGGLRNWQPITEVWLNPSAEVVDSPPSKLQTNYSLSLRQVNGLRRIEARIVEVRLVGCRKSFDRFEFPTLARRS